MRDLRLARVTTLESPFQPYVAHYRLHRAAAPSATLAARFEADNAARITAAIGDADPLSRRAYHLVLLDSMVHEFNAIRGVLGEPDRLEFADIREHGLTAILRFGATQCIVAWVDLPGMARYQMEFAFYALDRRLTLVVSVAVPAQHADAADHRGRRSRWTARVARPRRSRPMRKASGRNCCISMIASPPGARR